MVGGEQVDLTSAPFTDASIPFQSRSDFCWISIDLTADAIIT